MKWFKHISDSLTDPFIHDLIRTYGAKGYLVFFGILEIYAREFKSDEGWMLDTSLSYLNDILCTSRSNSVQTCLTYINDSGKWHVEFNSKRVKIFIPKFRELLDDYTLKKISKNESKCRDNVTPLSGECPEKNRPEVELEVDKEKERNKEKESLPDKSGYSSCFLEFWSTYPKKDSSKKEAFKQWQKAKDKPTVEIIIQALRKQISHKETLKKNGAFCPEWPDAERWIKKARWEDEIRSDDNSDPYKDLEYVKGE